MISMMAQIKAIIPKLNTEGRIRGLIASKLAQIQQEESCNSMVFPQCNKKFNRRIPQTWRGSNQSNYE